MGIYTIKMRGYVCTHRHKYILESHKMMGMYIKHSLIRPNTLEWREYQIDIWKKAISKNTLVVLPTGLGKTIIEVLIIAEMIKKYPESKALVLAPTKPLVEQHANVLKKSLTVNDVYTLSGIISPEKRKDIWKRGKIFVATPQSVEHDIISGTVDLSEFSVLCIDEAHHSVGKHPYGFIAKEFRKKRKDGLIVGFTASPGADKEKISEIIRNLYIEQVIAKNEYDRDVQKYIQKVNIIWKKVPLPPEFIIIIEKLKGLLKKYAKVLKSKKLIKEPIKKSDLIELLKKQGSNEFVEKFGNEISEIMKSIAATFVLLHALELIETQGSSALNRYLDRLIKKSKQGGAPKYLREIVASSEFLEIYENTRKMIEMRIEHPKIEEIKRILQNENVSKVIIFTQYRDTAKLLEECIPSAKRLIGQSSRHEKGMTQKEQLKVVDEFRRGLFRILITTSVGEEGLDISECDLVIFYEPVPSEIRAIQRKGRTGRSRKGKAIILIAEKTRDESYYWAAKQKERKMRRIIREIQRNVIKARSGTLDEFMKDPIEYTEEKTGKKKEEKKITNAISDKSQEKIDGTKPEKIIYVDYRERATEVVRVLHELGARLIFNKLDAGDYVVSADVVIERKNMRDFAESIVDGRIFNEIKRMKETYEHPVIIVERGGITRGIQKEGIYGMIASIMIDFGVPVYLANSAKEAAEFIYTLARLRQKEKGRSFSIRSGKPKDLNSILEYILGGVPEIGYSLARKLLAHFKTIEKIATASEDEFKKIEGIGEKIAKRLREIFTHEYGTHQ